ncbi:unnamed protein product [Alternaria alternata]
MIASRLLPKSAKSVGDFIIHNKITNEAISLIPRPTNGIDKLEVKLEREGYVKLAVFTNEELIIDTGSVPATANHVSGRCIKAASNLDQASRWLNDCLRNHDHGPKVAATRPSRLVAVGTLDGSEHIKIVDSSDFDEKYIAVSYRWGATNNLLTTTKTSKLFHTSIAWDQLPKTFRDAVEIARELDISYIWIDSLCIVQDDPDDWETESAKMADIYNGAFLTIMAASASDSQGGFFQDRPAIREMVVLPYTDASGSTELNVFVGKELPGYEDIVFNGPLFRRGWVFQERLMSKRKLIFGQDQTYWECNTKVQSESTIRRRDKFAELNRPHNDLFLALSDPSYRMDKTWNRTSPEDLWMDLVSQYSLCSLTYETDRLPSLSGLARTFALRFGGSYAAGLWQDQIPCSMGWFVSQRRPIETDKREYCAPPWSWASINGSFMFRRGGQSEVEIVSAHIKLAGQDLYGKVCPDSSICVRGRLRRGKLVAREGKEYTAWLETEHGRLGNRGFLDRHDENLPLEVSFLEISSGRGFWDARCLLLHKTEPGNPFRRVGMADLAEADLFHGIQKEVITLV